MPMDSMANFLGSALAIVFGVLISRVTVRTTDHFPSSLRRVETGPVHDELTTPCMFHLI